MIRPTCAPVARVATAARSRVDAPVVVMTAAARSTRVDVLAVTADALLVAAIVRRTAERAPLEAAVVLLEVEARVRVARVRVAHKAAPSVAETKSASEAQQ